MSITEEQFLSWVKDLRFINLSFIYDQPRYHAMLNFASSNFPLIFRLLEQEAIPEQICLVEILCLLEIEKKVSHPDSCWRIFEKMVNAGAEIFHNFAEARIKAMVLRPIPRNLPEEMFVYLFDEDPFVRKSMLRLVGRAEKREAVPHLILLLDDDVWHVQLAAVDALKAIASPDALVALDEWEKQKK